MLARRPPWSWGWLLPLVLAVLIVMPVAGGESGAANSTSSNSTHHYSNSTHDDEHASHTNETPYTLYTGALLSLIMIISSLVKAVNTMPGVELPFSLAVFVAGGVLGLLARFVVDHDDCEYEHGDHDYYTLGWCGMRTARRVDPHLLLLILLPPLIYESASKMDWYVFKRGFDSIFVLAFPGVIFSFWLIAVLFQQLPIVSSEWPFAQALTLGAILAATDPVAVVAALHELGAPPSLSTVIDGESLFNDGSAMVMFLIFRAKGFEGEEMTMARGTGMFFQLSLGGVAVGTAFFLVLHFWLSYCAHSLWVDATLGVCLAVFGSFFVSEILFKVSGVLAVVVLGLGMGWYGKYSISPHAVERLDTVMEWLSVIAEAAIFFFAGVVSQSALEETTHRNHGGLAIGNVFYLYFIIHLVRGISIMLGSVVFLRAGKDRYQMEFKELLVVWFGGLRGAVGLALALEVYLETPADDADERIRRELLVYVSGIVVLTLLVNGTLIAPFYNGLNLYPELDEKRMARQTIIRRALQNMEEQTQHEWKHAMSNDWLYSEVMSKPLEMEKLRALVPDLTHVLVRTNGALSFDHRHRIENVHRFVINTLLPLAQARNTVQKVVYRSPHQHRIVERVRVDRTRRPMVAVETKSGEGDEQLPPLEDAADLQSRAAMVLHEGVTDRAHSNIALGPIVAPPIPVRGSHQNIREFAAGGVSTDGSSVDGGSRGGTDTAGSSRGGTDATETPDSPSRTSLSAHVRKNMGEVNPRESLSDVSDTAHLLMTLRTAAKNVRRRRHRQKSRHGSGRVHTVGLHAESYCNTVFNALATLYKAQFEQHELTEMALVHLDSARHKAISFFENEIKLTNHGKASEYGGKDQPTVLEKALDVELVQLVSELPNPVGCMQCCVDFANHGLLPPFIKRLILFRTFRIVYTAVETLCGFIRAHEMVLSYLSIVKEENEHAEESKPVPRLVRHMGSNVLGDAITDRVARKIAHVSKMAHEKLTQIEHQFPNAVYIVKMLLTAQTMTKTKMVQVQSLHHKGILNESDTEYLMKPLHATLEHLHHVTDHLSMGNLVKKSVGRVIMSESTFGNLLVIKKSSKIKPEQTDLA